MPKRLRQFEDSPEQAVKKQVTLKNDNIKIRNIRSLSSERTINMLFQGAMKRTNEVVSTALKCSCPKQDHTADQCSYCNKSICPSISRFCNICNEYFCEKCSLFMYDEKYNCLCYSCLNNI